MYKTNKKYIIKKIMNKLNVTSANGPIAEDEARDCLYYDKDNDIEIYYNDSEDELIIVKGDLPIYYHIDTLFDMKNITMLKDEFKVPIDDIIDRVIEKYSEKITCNLI